jgi:membrane-bound lytic murein transglycosylase D
MQLKTAALLAAAAMVSACAQAPTTDSTLLSGSETAARERSMIASPPAPMVEQAPAPAAVDQPKAIADSEKPAELPPPPADIWQRIRSGYRMNNLDNPLVREWENWYASRPDYVARMIERSGRYLYYIVEEVERRKMPAEIALLPMIESAYNPQAYSRSHASGMWQFIPSTGKLYGLRQNWWYDGRRDVIAATGAALDYLQNLYGMFGSWELALASYNWGEGAVSRAVARNQAKGLPTDYESLAMPAETRSYLPKLQAVKNIITDPSRFGLQIASIPNEPYFATVTVKNHMDVKLAAALAEMPLDEFKNLNPAHNKPVIQAGSSDTIVLPRHKVETFLTNLQTNGKPLVSWQAHTVKAGERPEKIAASHGMSLAELKELNGISGRRKIATGQPLLVPVKGSAEPYLPDLPATPVSLPKAIKAARHAQNTRRGVAKTRHVSGKKPSLAVSRTPAKRVKVSLRSKTASAKKVVVAQNRKD